VACACRYHLHRTAQPHYASCADAILG
jgi:hypothetical protein